MLRRTLFIFFVFTFACVLGLQKSAALPFPGYPGIFVSAGMYSFYQNTTILENVPIVGYKYTNDNLHVRLYVVSNRTTNILGTDININGSGMISSLASQPTQINTVVTDLSFGASNWIFWIRNQFYTFLLVTNSQVYATSSDFFARVLMLNSK